MRSWIRLISFTMAVTLFAAIQPVMAKSTNTLKSFDLEYSIAGEAGNSEALIVANLHHWLEENGNYKLAVVEWNDVINTSDQTEAPTEVATLSPTIPTPSATEPAVTPSIPTTPSPTNIPVMSKLNEWLSMVGNCKVAVVEWSDAGIIADETPEPTATPTLEPTAMPTLEPTAMPTLEPTATPTLEPTAMPTLEPTATPTLEPTAMPTPEPTAAPTLEPTAMPTPEPTATPTPEPTATPTPELEPTAIPTPSTPDVKCSIFVNTEATEASINLINTFNEDKNVIVYVAQYNELGVLVGIKAEEIVVPGGTIVPKEYIVRPDIINENMIYLKAFVWDANKEMKPITVFKE